MDPRTVNLPLSARVALIFIALYAFVYLMYIGAGIIVPIVFSGLFAVVLNPLVRFFQCRKISKVASIIFSLLISFLLLGVLIWFLISQLSMFADKLPAFESRFNQLMIELTAWVSDTFHIPHEKVDTWIENSRSNILVNSNEYIGTTIYNVTGFVLNMILVPIYIFMIIYYEPLFVEFVKRVFPKENHVQISEMMTESKLAIQHFLLGLLLEALIVSCLNAAVLLALGIEYALLLGIIGGLMNIIPYIGGMTSIFLPTLFALVTKDSFSSVALVLLSCTLIQFVDNNYIMPRIVASKVKLNALVSVIGVLVGGAIWGVPGMFLSIPLSAIMKIVCDRIEVLKPYGYLFGVSMPASDNNFFNLWRRKKKVKVIETLTTIQPTPPQV